MLKLSKKVLIGTIAATLLLGGSAFAKVKYGEKIAVNYANIKMVINGQVIDTKAEPFTYNKNVYVPVATVANFLGAKQQWVNKDSQTGTPTVRIDGWMTGKPPVLDSVKAPEGFKQLSGDVFTKKSLDDHYRTYEVWTPGTGILKVPPMSKEGFSSTATLIDNLAIKDGNMYIFYVHEYLWNETTSENYFSTYVINNGVVTRVNSQLIQHEKGLHPYFYYVTSDNLGGGSRILVRYKKANTTTGDPEIAGIQEYQIVNHELILYGEKF